MIQIKNLTVIHKKDLRPLIENLSFVLHDGDKMAVIGEEGNGKSTLLKCIYDPSLVEEYAQISGEILRDGKGMGYLPQELPSKDRELSLWEYFQKNPGFYDCTPGELGQLAARLKLPADIFYGEQKMGTLSGGERVKTQLAGILLARPGTLLLDEPSNDIDMEALCWLEGFLRDCPVPVLYISHDETLLERTAGRILHMEQTHRKTKFGYTVTGMGYEAYVKERNRRFVRQEQEAQKEREEYDKQQERYRKICQKVEHQQNIISRGDPFGAQRLKQKMHTVKAMERRIGRQAEEMTDFPDREEEIFLKFPKEHPLPAGKEVLSVSLDVLEAGDKVLSRNIRLTVRGPEKIGIVGKNGMGKTTLLKKLLAALEEKENMTAAYMPQKYEELLEEDQTPMEFLEETGDKSERDRHAVYLGSLKFTREEMFHPIRELSGGQKAKLLLLKCSLGQADVLVLDEPTRNISPLSGPVIRQLLKEYPGAILSVSHDRKYLEEVCGQVYELTEQGLINAVAGNSWKD
ncbi:MAG: ATP-binding cassette domain-containing protein [Blautia sp.]|jgi:ATPase subunit of ABC transporter with duplicated ATPase domains